MNLVRNSLYLCVGVLLALIALQGTQSLWQISRLAQMNGEIAASASSATKSRLLWDEFRSADEAFKRAIAFTDAVSGDDLRKEFSQHVERVRAVLNEVSAESAGPSVPEFQAVKTDLEQWSALALRHLSSQGETELPAYDVLDNARSSLEQNIGRVAAARVASAQALALQSRQDARQASLWTVVALLLGVLAGGWLSWHAVSGLRRQLGGDPAEVVAMSNTLASGDLSASIDMRRAAEGSVVASVVHMRDKLVELIGQVRGSADSISTASAEIASGNMDLSGRTEQQASALEETSASMEQLGSTVRQNADNARQASQMAQAASSVAMKGGDVVGQVVDTMKGINDSSRKISDIIGVIDGIAFQTNILALNAAVEAARAGEQGRGFAVVAGEVRSLAQRSADAAKEIKTLIHASVERVERGTQLVDQAGSTMTEIVTAIQRVSDIVGEISTASAEQSAGVAQVGEAITQMDHSTQQNAALVEESAAAAESLKLQARQLVSAVAAFKLAQGAGGLSQAPSASTPATRSTAPSESVAPTASATAVAETPRAERRGPDRARNVVRPSFSHGARPSPAKAAQASSAPAEGKTGTDEWETF